MHHLCCSTSNSWYLSCDGARYLILPFLQDPFYRVVLPGVPAPAESVHILYTSIISSDTGDGMADDDIQIESAAGALTSGIQKTSAIMMKAAYLPVSLKKQDGGFGVPFFKTASGHHDEDSPGRMPGSISQKFQRAFPLMNLTGFQPGTLPPQL